MCCTTNFHGLSSAVDPSLHHPEFYCMILPSMANAMMFNEGLLPQGRGQLLFMFYVLCLLALFLLSFAFRWRIMEQTKIEWLILWGKAFPRSLFVEKKKKWDAERRGNKDDAVRRASYWVCGGMLLLRRGRYCLVHWHIMHYSNSSVQGGRFVSVSESIPKIPSTLYPNLQGSFNDNPQEPNRPYCPKETQTEELWVFLRKCFDGKCKLKCVAWQYDMFHSSQFV